MTTASTISVSGTKTLDLNGYGIKATSTGCSVITVGSSANLTINDSDTSKTHKFTSPSGTAGLATLDEESGTLSISGGYITGGNTSEGGGIMNQGSGNPAVGIVKISGGFIKNNTVNKKAGGGVFRNVRLSCRVLLTFQGTKRATVTTILHFTVTHTTPHSMQILSLR